MHDNARKTGVRVPRPASLFKYPAAGQRSASDVTIKIVGTLQQYTGGSWVHVTSWTTTGVGTAVLDKQYAVSRGYKYRFIARFYIYDANGSFVESDMASCIYDYHS